MNKTIVLIFTILTLAAATFAANLANPAAQVGDARLAFGASYYLGGADITDYKIPMMMNRIGGRVSFSPVRYANIGVDFGSAQVSVDRYVYTIGPPDTIPLFDGNFGWFAGGHLKLSSPYIAGYVSAMVLGSVTYFRSANDHEAHYAGLDITAAGGPQIRIQNIGLFISLGPQLYLIDGKNKGDDKVTNNYSNVNNMRAWIALDYFPKEVPLTWNYKPYVSVEFTASPKIGGSKRTPIREFSLSFSMGATSQRLYGQDSGDDFE